MASPLFRLSREAAAVAEGATEAVGKAEEGRKIVKSNDQALAEWVDPKIVNKIQQELLGAGDPDSRLLAMYISDNYHVSGNVQRFKDGSGKIDYLQASAAPDPAVALDRAIRQATNQGKTIPRRQLSLTLAKAKNWGVAFIVLYFDEIRKLICGTKQKPTPLGAKTHSVLTAVAAMVAHALGLSGALPLGIAILLLINLAGVGKKTLCKMTSAKELENYFA